MDFCEKPAHVPRCPEIGAEARGLGTTYKFDAANTLPKAFPETTTFYIQPAFSFNRWMEEYAGHL